ncbi:MAG: hypothetical protein MO852_09145 [Candidatus Devosia euplotis]|nr:hypothetical protein [Candidatus Devosia euplotis]
MPTALRHFAAGSIHEIKQMRDLRPQEGGTCQGQGGRGKSLELVRFALRSGYSTRSCQAETQGRAETRSTVAPGGGTEKGFVAAGCGALQQRRQNSQWLF